MSYYFGQRAITLSVKVGSVEVYTFTPPSTGSTGVVQDRPFAATFSVPQTTTYPITITLSLANAGTTGNNSDLYLSNVKIACA